MSNYKQFSNKKGFTLLETLLIIAIVGIIAAITLSSYQKRSSVTKIEKAAIEMEQLLQSASTFYVIGTTPNTDKTNRWPAYEGSTDQMPDYFVDYLPIATNTTPVVIANPWGKPYFIDGSEKDKFKVATETPNADTAKTLAGKLPFGSVDTENNKKIYAYVPAPEQSSLIINSIGIAKEGDPLPIPQGCPEGTGADYISAVNYIRSNLKHTYEYPNFVDKYAAITSHIIGSPISSFYTAALWNGTTNWQLTLNFKQANDCGKKSSCKDINQIPDSGKTWDGKVVEARVLYFTYCQPIQ